MPTSCSRAPPATTTSASRSRIPWSATIAGSTPALTSRRSSRRAMLRTICMWTQEWSDIPSRSDWTWVMYHQARTCSSPLTASRKLSSLRLPRVGARTFASAIASFGGLRVGPCGSGAGTRLASLAAIVGRGVGCPCPPSASAADRPGAGARLRVEQSRAVVLLGLGGRRRVAGAADRFPGAGVELVFAAVAAVGGDGGGVAAGLAGGDRFEGRDGDAAGQGGERFAALLRRLAARRSARIRICVTTSIDAVEAVDRPPQRGDRDRLGVSRRATAVAAVGAGRGERGRREGESEERAGRYVCVL